MLSTLSLSRVSSPHSTFYCGTYVTSPLSLALSSPFNPRLHRIELDYIGLEVWYIGGGV